MISYEYTQFSSLYKMVLDMFRLLYLVEETNNFQMLTASVLFRNSMFFGLV